MADWERLQQELKVSFKNLSLLQQAFVHRSYLNENPSFYLPSNERLEFLGDAVLGFVVASELYHRFPALPEGKLTALRASLVRRETLAQIASSLNLGDFFYLGRGEETSGGRKRESNLAQVLEAVIGAIFLDQGLVKAKSFILKLFRPEIKKLKAVGASPDYKSLLQEFAQAKYQLTPVYHLVDASGPDHNKKFTMEVRVGDMALSRGSGKSKQAAEREAARSAWENLHIT